MFEEFMISRYPNLTLSSSTVFYLQEALLKQSIFLYYLSNRNWTETIEHAAHRYLQCILFIIVSHCFTMLVITKFAYGVFIRL